MKKTKDIITLKVDSVEIQHLCSVDPDLALLIKNHGELKYSLHDNPFGFFVETIIGQMLSNKVADILTARMFELCSGDLSLTNILGLSKDEIKSIGLSEAKSSYIIGFAQHIKENPSFFNKLEKMNDSEAVTELVKIRGIGSWTAKMYLIFVLNRFDILPYEDGAFLQVYRWLYKTDDVRKQSVMQRCEPWKPYSSIGARYFYKFLDSGMLRL